MEEWCQGDEKRNQLREIGDMEQNEAKRKSRSGKTNKTKIEMEKKIDLK